MFPMSGVGFMGRKKGGDIPVPEAGVCTVYPIAIPVTSGLIHYSSPFNWCDQYQDVAGTVSTGIPNGRVGNSNDLSGSLNPLLALDFLEVRRTRYNDSGLGNVRWDGGTVGGNTTRMEIDSSWVIGSDIKTVIILAQRNNTTALSQLGLMGANGGDRFWYYINTSGNVAINDGAARDSTLSVDLNYRALSLRCESTVKVGVDKTYQQVKAAPIRPNTQKIAFIGIGEFNINWASPCRDIAIYDRALSDTEVDIMVDYMKAKWNL